MIFTLYSVQLTIPRPAWPDLWPLPQTGQRKFSPLFLDVQTPVRRLFRLCRLPRHTPPFDTNWQRQIQFPPDASRSTLTIFKIQCKSYRGLVHDNLPQYWLSLTIRGMRQRVSAHQQPEATAVASPNAESDQRESFPSKYPRGEPLTLTGKRRRLTSMQLMACCSDRVGLVCLSKRCSKVNVTEQAAFT